MQFLITTKKTTVIFSQQSNRAMKQKNKKGWISLEEKIIFRIWVLAVLLAGTAWAGNQVVVTPTGRKYHRPDCRTLHKEVRWMSI